MRLPIVVIATALMLLLESPSARAATAPASTQPAATDDPAVGNLIAQLGDLDPRAREAASKALWSRGRPAAPALRAAAAGDDPEIARRAQAILRDFTYGLYPDAPREIFTLLDQYRRGDAGQRRTAVWELGSKGVSGLRVLLKLREDERDPALHQMISQVLAPREHEVAVLMLADGQAADLEQILEKAAYDSPVAAQDYAALLLTTGRLQERLGRLKADPPAARSATVLVALARAAGGLPAARAAAERTGNADLLDAILVEQGDWNELARRLAAHPDRMEAPQRLGYLCAYYRLAGDEALFQQTARALADHAAHTPADYPACADNLLLNGLPDEGIAVLLAHKDYIQASNYLAPRLRFREALELPKRAEQEQPAEAGRVRAHTVSALHFVGRVDEARQTMEEVAVDNRVRNDFATWLYLIEGAQELTLAAKADEYAAAALARATRQDPIASLFEKMHLGDGLAASQWWQFLRLQHKEEPPERTLARLHSLFDHTTAGAELEQLADAAARYGAELAIPDRQAWEETVAGTLSDCGRPDLASKIWDRLIHSVAPAAPGARLLTRAGEFEAGRQNWAAAAEDFDRAWERDRTEATALFLRGWALTRMGQEQEGRRLTDLAHALPLGGEAERHEMIEAMSRHKLTNDVRREIALLLSVTQPRSWERNDALREAAEAAATAGDQFVAAGLWERAFLQNLSNNFSFREPWANIVVPALVHKARALGFIKSGQIAAAVREAQITLAEVPADADALIEIVDALDKAGHKPEADALFAQHTSLYRKLVADYPTSGPGHNQLAWAQVMCHRQLDDALRNARRAVELEPASTASLDTLAEVYFARGDPASAAAQMRKCIELEPKVERHRQQLVRFQAAARTNFTGTGHADGRTQ